VDFSLYDMGNYAALLPALKGIAYVAQYWDGCFIKRSNLKWSSLYKIWYFESCFKIRKSFWDGISNRGISIK
jgi:hypothetical protein